MATLFASIEGVTLPTPQPVPAPTVPSGPLGNYLAHPGATTSHLVHHLAHVAAHLAVTFGPAAAGVALVGLVALTVIRRTQARRMGEDARLVLVLTPPDVDPQGAATLWTNLVALLRPAWRRFLGGQPHLGFELTASDGGLTIAIWVPGQIPPGLVERAVEAAWPGARTETVPAVPPLVGDGVATGGTLALALPEHYPLRTEHKVDPLRPLIGALAGLDEGESAAIQILARPVTGRRLNRLHKAATARRSGRPATRLARLIDLVTPGPAAQAPATDPSRSADVADILDKAAQPSWAISIRYAVATTATDGQATLRLRGRAQLPSGGLHPPKTTPRDLTCGGRRRDPRRRPSRHEAARPCCGSYPKLRPPPSCHPAPTPWPSTPPPPGAVHDPRGAGGPQHPRPQRPQARPRHLFGARRLGGAGDRRYACPPAGRPLMPAVRCQSC